MSNMTFSLLAMDDVVAFGMGSSNCQKVSAGSKLVGMVSLSIPPSNNLFFTTSDQVLGIRKILKLLSISV